MDRNTGRDGADETIHPAVVPAWRLSSATSWHLLFLSLQLSSVKPECVCVCVCYREPAVFSFKDYTVNKVDYTFIKAPVSPTIQFSGLACDSNRI
ncbi:hypothetical protein EXN66_Car011860 [Channa argus]|uniref:Uncharacterized protein n=1 Tax=Channa argus TaxID=215402 RepID=A0A6G1Q1B7_CHAAH|nr:hypothetical protein EXN66_Car011860 [Channa argus]